jgi:8-oxo-dGTP diphosphatase
MHWVRLRHFEFRIALRAAQNFALFDFVFVQIDFGIALRASGQGCLSYAAVSRPTAYYITPVSRILREDRPDVTHHREYPDRPVVGVGGVVVSEGRALLVKRGRPPLEGQWSIPGGMLEAGETLLLGVRRELLEETGIEVKVLELIEVFERINLDGDGKARYHYVVLDYLCEAIRGHARAGSDAIDVVWATPAELPRYGLTETATRVVLKAFDIAREHLPHS